VIAQGVVAAPRNQPRLRARAGPVEQLPRSSGRAGQFARPNAELVDGQRHRSILIAIGLEQSARPERDEADRLAAGGKALEVIAGAGLDLHRFRGGEQQRRIDDAAFVPARPDIDLHRFGARRRRRASGLHGERGGEGDAGRHFFSDANTTIPLSSSPADSDRIAWSRSSDSSGIRSGSAVASVMLAE